MSKVTEPMLLDKTGQQLLGAMTKQNELLTAIASGYNYKPTSIADVFAVVQSGNASQVFNYGDQIILPWTDKATCGWRNRTGNVGTVALCNAFWCAVQPVPGV